MKFLFALMVILAVLMRFYNFSNLQYFSGDEEIFHAILRRMVVEGKPTLVIPNAQVGGSIGSFLLFPGGAFEYYLLGFFPLFLFLPAILLGEVRFLGKVIIVGMVLLFTVIGILTVMNTNTDFSFKTKKELISQVMKVIDGEPFELYENGICHKYEGWRYLFSIYGKKPERSSTDGSLGWLYQKEITDKKTRYSVIVSELNTPLDYDIKKAVKIVNGGFIAYITERE